MSNNIKHFKGDEMKFALFGLLILLVSCVEPADNTIDENVSSEEKIIEEIINITEEKINITALIKELEENLSKHDIYKEYYVGKTVIIEDRSTNVKRKITLVKFVVEPDEEDLLVTAFIEVEHLSNKAKETIILPRAYVTDSFGWKSRSISKNYGDHPIFVDRMMGLGEKNIGAVSYQPINSKTETITFFFVDGINTVSFKHRLD